MTTEKENLFRQYKQMYIWAVETGEYEYELASIREEIKKKYPKDLKSLDRKLTRMKGPCLDGTTPYSIIKHRILDRKGN